jgi:4-cresol dehydrogenase (hydroxylating)
MDQFKRTYALYQKYGMDYHASFAMSERSLVNVNQLLYDKDDPAMMGRVDAMFRALVADASAHHYGEYRTHIDYMDLVASSYDFNDRALLRLNNRVKAALDPNGVIAPGKSGIWGRNR